MNDISDSSANAEAIAAAVEQALAAQPGASAAEKLAKAQTIYLTWRNNNLGNLPVDVFHLVEAASGQLIAAIAAAF